MIGLFVTAQKTPHIRRPHTGLPEVPEDPKGTAHRRADEKTRNDLSSFKSETESKTRKDHFQEKCFRSDIPAEACLDGFGTQSEIILRPQEQGQKDNRTASDQDADIQILNHFFAYLPVWTSMLQNRIPTSAQAIPTAMIFRKAME